MQIKFQAQNNAEFFLTLKNRVENYFTSNNISKNANGLMIFKTVFLLATLFGLLSLVYFTPLNNVTGALVCIGIGAFTAFIGFNVSHDATHGSYSSNSTVNKLLAYTFDLCGASSYMWSIAHNQVHHTYTNIPEHDDDLEPVFFIRLHEEKKLYWIHRFQHWYASFFYMLTSISWVFLKDYKTMFAKNILNHALKPISLKDASIILISKALYLFMYLVLPIMLGYTVLQVVVGFLLIHIVEGFILAIVFQLAHVVENVQFPMPKENGTIENNWAVHQLYTTTNFARKSKLATFFFGGLNYQVEHHLFPRICHVHYTKLSEIVMQTAKEFNIPYNDYKTMWKAMISHFKMLKMLGKFEQLNLAK